jgi:hypothetical protein
MAEATRESFGYLVMNSLKDVASEPDKLASFREYPEQVQRKLIEVGYFDALDRISKEELKARQGRTIHF